MQKVSGDLEVVYRRKAACGGILVSRTLAHIRRHCLDLKDLLIARGIDPRQVLVS
jgi:hypothetical protein